VPTFPYLPPVGDGDLYPFPSIINPVVPPIGGTGSLVGPNHPLFGMNYIITLFLIYAQSEIHHNLQFRR
jgi:hypothetical protein